MNPNTRTVTFEPVPVTVPSLVPAFFVMSSEPLVFVVVVKEQLLQVRLLILPLTGEPVVLLVLPSTVLPLHVSANSPDVSLRRAEVPLVRLESSVAPELSVVAPAKSSVLSAEAVPAPRNAVRAAAAT